MGRAQDLILQQWQEGNPATRLLLLALPFAALAVLMAKMLLASVQNDEPPLAPMGSFLTGHTVTYGKDPSVFLSKLRNLTIMPTPYTLRIMTRKAYVFFHPNDPKILWRNSTTKPGEGFSWNTLSSITSCWLFGISGNDKRLCIEDCDRKDSFFTSTIRKYHLMENKDAASAGMSGCLTSMCNTYTERAEKMFDLFMLDIERIEDEAKTINILEFLRNFLLDVSTHALWGPRNPYATSANPEKFKKSFFDYETGITAFIFELFPRIFRPSVYNGREYCVNEWKHYYENKDNVDVASTVIQQRFQICQNFGYSNVGIARADIGLVFAAVSNTKPAILWSLYHMWKSNIVPQVRQELLDNGGVKFEEDGIRMVINVPILTQKSPLLNAVWEETLRMYHDGAFVRVVEGDTRFPAHIPVDGKPTEFIQRPYLLRKGNIVQIPSPSLMRNEAIWGTDVGEWNPYRFVALRQQQSQGKMSPEDKLKTTSFLPFGGGVSYCPGRHFAWFEVATLLTVLSFMVDMEFQEPIKQARPMGFSLINPDSNNVPISVKRTDWGRRVVERKFIVEGGRDEVST